MIVPFTYPTETLTVPAAVLPHGADGEPLQLTVRTNLTPRDLARFWAGTSPARRAGG